MVNKVLIAGHGLTTNGAKPMTDPLTHDHPARTIAKAVAARPGRAAVPIASVTATQLGEHLGLTRQRIGVLADTEHVIERLPNGRFNQDDCRLRYLRWLRDPARRSARSEAAATHVEAKTQLLRIRIGGKSSAPWCAGMMSMP
jgi:hypothetical protein